MHKQYRIAGMRLAPLGAAAVLAASAHAQTNHYVWPGGSHTPPYTNWAMAAHDIQSAIDASAVGDVVWVTNGVYDTGGRTNYPSGTGLTNRVVINRAVTVQSVNGPDVTVIKGARDPATTNGPAAVRCVYISSGSKLSGFTITNGATLNSGAHTIYESGGGVFVVSSAEIFDCVISGNNAYRTGGGVDLYYGGVQLYDCRLIGNTARASGGAIRTHTVSSSNNRILMSNCVVACNYAASGCGGTENVQYMYDCVIYDNSSGGYGAGVARTLGSEAHVYNGLIYGNSGASGGSGSMSCTLYHCMLTNNLGPHAIFGGVIYNSLVIGNEGEGVRMASAYNSTVVGNVVGVRRGGSGVIRNCVVYYNQVNTYATTEGEYYYSCTIPAVPGWDASNTTNAPMLADPGYGYGTNHVYGNYRLTKGSPCVNHGMYYSWMSDPTNEWLSRDFDGGPRIMHNNVDMGAYESRIKRGTTFSAE